MNYMISLLNESQSKFKRTHEGLYIISEKELINALEYSHDKGMGWAYQIMLDDIKKRERGVNNNE